MAYNDAISSRLPEDSVNGHVYFVRDRACLQVSFFESQSKFPFRNTACARIFLLLLFLLAAGCEPESVRQEKELRRQVVHELRHHAYANAAALARQLVQRAPRDERGWKQLVRAQIRLHDLEGAKQSLADWRRAVEAPSARRTEFEGDIAREEQQSSAALSAWQKVVEMQPDNHRVREKIARLYQAQKEWKKADAAWTAAIQIKDDPISRINRAVCRRRLHRWKEAFEDLHRARQLGPDDPQVRRWSRLFNGLARYLDQIGELDAKLAMLPDDAGLLADRALLFLRCGDAELALDAAKKAADLAPWAVRPKLFEGIALADLNRVRERERLAVREPLRLDSLTPEFLENMSRLDSAISVERSNPDHFVARSWQLNEIGQPEACPGRRGNSPSARFEIGRSPGRSRLCFEQARANGPGSRKDQGGNGARSQSCIKLAIPRRTGDGARRLSCGGRFPLSSVNHPTNRPCPASPRRMLSPPGTIRPCQRRSSGCAETDSRKSPVTVRRDQGFAFWMAMFPLPVRISNSARVSWPTVRSIFLRAGPSRLSCSKKSVIT